MSIQLNLLDSDGDSRRGRRLAMSDADVVFYDRWFSPKDGDRLFAAIDQLTQWQQDHITLYGKTLPLPRLTAWHGDAGKPYTYSGITMCPHPWTAPLLEIKHSIAAVCGIQFNSVLLNKYRTGKDSVAWHSDDEPELGPNPVIASVSLGATRRFVFRHRHSPEIIPISIDLTHGSLLMMQGTTQHAWQHQLPKTKKLVEPRINLTFRLILSTSA